ncbi:MAG: glycine zipper 2TM domain-containing protein [Rhodanobacteraceae bacterium]
MNRFGGVVLVIMAALSFRVACAQGPARDSYAPDSANVKYAWADVLRVDPVYDQVPVHSPQRECEDVPVTRRDDRGNNAAGTVLGAVIGGVLGNQVGKGDGRKAATVAGAVAGGAIGHGIASRDDEYYDDTQPRCRTVDRVSQERRIAGYDVQYRYRGEVYASRLDYDPGERIRVRVTVAPAE